MVICGAISSWRCSALWSDDYLVRKIGQRKVGVTWSPDGRFGIFSSRMTEPERSKLLTFREFIAELAPDRATDAKRRVYYLQQKALATAFPELMNDVGRPAFVPPARLVQLNFWFGEKSSRIPLHFDTFDNLLVQVRGAKRVVLIPPSQSRYLYPGADEAEFASKVDLDEPDFDRFPLYREVTNRISFELDVGQILYIPAYWWHHVTTVSDTAISLNYWYDLVYGSRRDEYLLARDVWRSGIELLRRLPDGQKVLGVRDCEDLLESVRTRSGCKVHLMPQAELSRS